jgi:hypothetical protein
MVDINRMSHDKWLAYREKQIETIEATGKKLLPNPECGTCDIDNDYVCFECECIFIDEGKELAHG